MELTPTEQMALDAVREIVQAKRDLGRRPDMATIDEIMAQVRNEYVGALRKLCRAGILDWHENINRVLMFNEPIREGAGEDPQNG